ncbi:SDR family oxidoreductase [Rivibacter subsaxonicus]|uniref:NAD(P)-dependent dehydrogenase (Short-subunit alcohol dehydrogenase family) n=1 Tax=Rivibacter subsaxonicus TaxID=457575 RepID=A0A4Q7VVQ9_9BURK|nr:SDR family oxidoreductase [Rivibacter subsaxonicus]RZU00741.1 NAD(P)-dependent dehydrogenase (short-subunit alcohol dehydrogenase family) [Rivibacter subsaxonicus]
MNTGRNRQLLLVTGGSRGIGAATVRLAAGRGWAVAINYASAATAAEALVREIEAGGGEAAAFRADVADEAQVHALFAAVDARFGHGRLRGLVNNAGIVDVAARIEQMSAERVARIFAVNVVGSFACAREAVLRMSTRHGGAGGAIVNLSSRAAERGSAGIYADYAASKAAIDRFTVDLALEVAAEGVRVNGVRPGIIDTEIHAAAGLADRVREMSPTLPMQRAGTAEEVAQAILWLLSDEASYVTGAMLDVAGGR